MIKRILVGLGDQAYAAQATREAIRFAEQFGAELTGITLYDLSDLTRMGSVPIGAGQLAVELREQRLAQMNQAIQAAIGEFESACQAANLKHRLVQGTGNPFDGLISNSRYHDLTVCGLQNLFGHGIVEEPPVELVRLVEAGVRPLIAVAEHDVQVRKALIAYSGSCESAKTMKRFVQMRLWPDAALHIATFNKPDDEARSLLSDAADYCRAHGFNTTVEHVKEDPKYAVLKYAQDHQMDAIVIGNSARNLTLRRVFGETALHVMQNANCPLFLSQ